MLAFIFPNLVWCWWHIIKQIFHDFSCLISKLFTLGNIIFNLRFASLNINYLRWIIFDIQQKGMEYLLIKSMEVPKAWQKTLKRISFFSHVKHYVSKCLQNLYQFQHKAAKYLFKVSNTSISIISWVSLKLLIRTTEQHYLMSFWNSYCRLKFISLICFFFRDFECLFACWLNPF